MLQRATKFIDGSYAFKIIILSVLANIGLNFFLADKQHLSLNVPMTICNFASQQRTSVVVVFPVSLQVVVVGVAIDIDAAAVIDVVVVYAAICREEADLEFQSVPVKLEPQNSEALSEPSVLTGPSKTRNYLGRQTDGQTRRQGMKSWVRRSFKKSFSRSQASKRGRSGSSFLS